ncbi:hypothetical protein LTT66_32840 [Nocardia gipuzkoensis]|uniref:hypothetical protein n=1 Tax=Nocardia gipuzkoensis TaxID=2749991 RepID=UPI001E5866D2|nr:hypothetical protein [Nocardia gipuzkoensis]UGT67908.1 hypothetical protein LTT66_32840 [Nocardia gipuzkoensis]
MREHGQTEVAGKLEQILIDVIAQCEADKRSVVGCTGGVDETMDVFRVGLRRIRLVIAERRREAEDAPHPGSADSFKRGVGVLGCPRRETTHGHVRRGRCRE